MAAPPGEFAELTARLRAGGMDDVTVLGPAHMSPSEMPSFSVAVDITGPEARRRDLRILRFSS